MVVSNGRSANCKAWHQVTFFAVTDAIDRILFACSSHFAGWEIVILNLCKKDKNLEKILSNHNQSLK
jgi:hypothetical protein